MDEKDKYSYNLPPELIALSPAKPRSSSRMLVYEKCSIEDSHFFELDTYLQEGDHLIFNNTKVQKSRFFGVRERVEQNSVSAPKIEVLLLNKLSEHCWSALCKPAKKLKLFDEIKFNNLFSAKVIEATKPEFILEFNFETGTDQQNFEEVGQLPLPPYILKSRDYQESDTTDYQTIFAKNQGAIAAPTASLHFDGKLLKKIAQKKINYSFVTLHVGPGTFFPIRAKKITDHRMHSENGQISEKAAHEINRSKKNGGRIIPVGTTALRLIESACDKYGFLRTFDGSTDIFIKPGYSFKISDGLITNFHFPNSTLFLLIVAFLGLKETHRVYNHAINQRYRFYSYGDGSLLIRK